MIPTIFSPKFNFSGIPAELYAISFNSSIVLISIFPLIFLIMSPLLGFIAIPSFVTIASTTSPGVVIVVTFSLTIGFFFLYNGTVTIVNLAPAAVS